MKKIVCLILSVVLVFSALSISASAVEAIRYGDINDDGVVNLVDLYRFRLRLANIITNKEII